MNHPLRIGVIGDFKPGNLSHLATNEAIQHAAGPLSLAVEVTWLPTPALDGAAQGVDATLSRFEGLWCAPGSPYQSMDGALNAVRFARQRHKPFVGT
jgi:CTP synthase (UTP-ammonia lyase)